MTTKTYTDRSNARRAAKAAGLDTDTITFVQVDGRWTWVAKEEPAEELKIVDAPAEHIPAEEPTSVETDGDSRAWTPFADEPAPAPAQDARAARRQRLIAAAQAVAQPKAAKRETSPRGKLAIIHEMLKRPEGCTREEILSMTGWPSVSVQQCAGQLKIELAVDKASRPFRYRAAHEQALAA